MAPRRLNRRGFTLEQADYQAARRLAVQRCTSSAGRSSSAICHLAGLLDLVLLVAQFPKGTGYFTGTLPFCSELYRFSFS